MYLISIPLKTGIKKDCPTKYATYLLAIVASLKFS